MLANVTLVRLTWLKFWSALLFHYRAHYMVQPVHCNSMIVNNSIPTLSTGWTNNARCSGFTQCCIMAVDRAIYLSTAAVVRPTNLA